MSEARLLAALRRCSLHALLMLAAKALTRAGFGDVQTLDRRTSRQRSRFGGHELVCLGQVGTLPVKVAVKLVRQDVRTRMLDELAGTVLRTGADLGLIVTPYALTGAAAKRLGSHPRARVEVMDGPALARLLASQGIGVREDGSVDRTFFAGLEEASERLLGFIREAKG